MTATLRHSPLVMLIAAVVLSGCATGDIDLLPVVAGGDPADDLLPVNPGTGDDLLPVNPGADDDLLPVVVEPEPDTPECLRGVWLLDNASFRDLIQPETRSAGGTVRSVTGQVVQTFGEGDTFETLYDGWTIITETADGSATIERNGVDAGTVRHASGRFTLVEQQSGSSIEGFVETPGGSFPLPNVGTAAELFEETAGYRCSGDFMTMSIAQGELSFRRF